MASAVALRVIREAVHIEDSREFGHSIGIESVPRPGAARCPSKQASVGEFLQVVADRGLAQADDFLKVAHARLLFVADDAE